MIREEYVKRLIETLNRIEEKVAYKSPSLPQDTTHPFKPRDIMLVKTLTKGRAPGDFVYGKPTNVVVITRTALLTKESPTWIHTT